jgi:hypothetical protein
MDLYSPRSGAEVLERWLGGRRLAQEAPPPTLKQWLDDVRQEAAPTAPEFEFLYIANSLSFALVIRS